MSADEDEQEFINKHILTEAAILPVINDAARSLKTITLGEQTDLSDIVESDSTLGRFDMLMEVLFTDDFYYLSKIEFCKQNNKQGFIVKVPPPDEEMEAGKWHKIRCPVRKSDYTEDVASTPWDEMDRIEFYRSGAPTIYDEGFEIRVRNLRFRKPLIPLRERARKSILVSHGPSQMNHSVASEVKDWLSRRGYLVNFEMVSQRTAGEEQNLQIENAQTAGDQADGEMLAREEQDNSGSELSSTMAELQHVVAVVPVHTGTAHVEVVQARGLRAMDKGGTSDPFVVVSTGKQKKQTKAVKKTLEPSWGEQFSFEIGDLSEKLAVVVKDKDMMSSEVMGQVDLDLATLTQAGETRQWYRLEGKAGGNKGPAHGTAIVTVVQARGLRAMDKGGTSDPFVVVSTGKQKKQTKAVKKTLEPSWGEQFSFEIGDLSEKLAVVVKDKDMMSSEVMGQVDLDLSALTKGRDGVRAACEIRQWHKLTGKAGATQALGEIELLVQWKADSEVASIVAAQEMDEDAGEVELVVRWEARPKDEDEETAGEVELRMRWEEWSEGEVELEVRWEEGDYHGEVMLNTRWEADEHTAKDAATPPISASTNALLSEIDAVLAEASTALSQTPTSAGKDPNGTGKSALADLSRDEINDAHLYLSTDVDDAAAVVVLLSPEYEESERCRRTLSYARSRCRGYGVPLIPLLAGPAGWEPSGWMEWAMEGNMAVLAPPRVSDGGAECDEGAMVTVDRDTSEHEDDDEEKVPCSSALDFSSPVYCTTDRFEELSTELRRYNVENTSEFDVRIQKLIAAHKVENERRQQAAAERRQKKVEKGSGKKRGGGRSKYAHGSGGGSTKRDASGNTLSHKEQMRENLKVIASLIVPQSVTTLRDDLVISVREVLLQLRQIGRAMQPDDATGSPVVGADSRPVSRQGAAAAAVAAASIQGPLMGSVGSCGSGCGSAVIAIAAGVLEVKHWTNKLRDGHHDSNLQNRTRNAVGTAAADRDGSLGCESKVGKEQIGALVAALLDVLHQGVIPLTAAHSAKSVAILRGGTAAMNTSMSTHMIEKHGSGGIVGAATSVELIEMQHRFAGKYRSLLRRIMPLLEELKHIVTRQWCSAYDSLLLHRPWSSMLLPSGGADNARTTPSTVSTVIAAGTEQVADSAKEKQVHVSQQIIEEQASERRLQIQPLELRVSPVLSTCKTAVGRLGFLAEVIAPIAPEEAIAGGDTVDACDPTQASTSSESQLAKRHQPLLLVVALLNENCLDLPTETGGAARQDCEETLAVVEALSSTIGQLRRGDSIALVLPGEFSEQGQQQYICLTPLDKVPTAPAGPPPAVEAGATSADVPLDGHAERNDDVCCLAQEGGQQAAQLREWQAWVYAQLQAAVARKRNRRQNPVDDVNAVGALECAVKEFCRCSELLRTHKPIVVAINNSMRVAPEQSTVLAQTAANQLPPAAAAIVASAKDAIATVSSAGASMSTLFPMMTPLPAVHLADGNFTSEDGEADGEEGKEQGSSSAHAPLSRQHQHALGRALRVHVLNCCPMLDSDGEHRLRRLTARFSGSCANILPPLACFSPQAQPEASAANQAVGLQLAQTLALLVDGAHNVVATNVAVVVRPPEGGLFYQLRWSGSQEGSPRDAVQSWVARFGDLCAGQKICIGGEIVFSDQTDPDRLTPSLTNCDVIASYTRPFHYYDLPMPTPALSPASSTQIEEAPVPSQLPTNDDGGSCSAATPKEKALARREWQLRDLDAEAEAQLLNEEQQAAVEAKDAEEKAAKAAFEEAIVGHSKPNFLRQRIACPAPFIDTLAYCKRKLCTMAFADLLATKGDIAFSDLTVANTQLDGKVGTVRPMTPAAPPEVVDESAAGDVQVALSEPNGRRLRRRRWRRKELKLKHDLLATVHDRKLLSLQNAEQHEQKVMGSSDFAKKLVELHTAWWELQEDELQCDAAQREYEETVSRAVVATRKFMQSSYAGGDGRPAQELARLQAAYKAKHGESRPPSRPTSATRAVREYNQTHGSITSNFLLAKADEAEADEEAAFTKSYDLGEKMKPKRRRLCELLQECAELGTVHAMAAQLVLALAQGSPLVRLGKGEGVGNGKGEWAAVFYFDRLAVAVSKLVNDCEQAADGPSRQPGESALSGVLQASSQHWVALDEIVAGSLVSSVDGSRVDRECAGAFTFANHLMKMSALSEMTGLLRTLESDVGSQATTVAKLNTLLRAAAAAAFPNDILAVEHAAYSSSVAIAKASPADGTCLEAALAKREWEEEDERSYDGNDQDMDLHVASADRYAIDFGEMLGFEPEWEEEQDEKKPQDDGEDTLQPMGPPRRLLEVATEITNRRNGRIATASALRPSLTALLQLVRVMAMSTTAEGGTTPRHWLRLAHDIISSAASERALQPSLLMYQTIAQQRVLANVTAALQCKRGGGQWWWEEEKIVLDQDEDQEGAVVISSELGAVATEEAQPEAVVAVATPSEVLPVVAKPAPPKPLLLPVIIRKPGGHAIATWGVSVPDAAGAGEDGLSHKAQEAKKEREKVHAEHDALISAPVPVAPKLVYTLRSLWLGVDGDHAAENRAEVGADGEGWCVRYVGYDLSCTLDGLEQSSAYLFQLQTQWGWDWFAGTEAARGIDPSRIVHVAAPPLQESPLSAAVLCPPLSICPHPVEFTGVRPPMTHVNDPHAALQPAPAKAESDSPLALVPAAASGGAPHSDENEAETGGGSGSSSEEEDEEEDEGGNDWINVRWPAPDSRRISQLRIFEHAPQIQHNDDDDPTHVAAASTMKRKLSNVPPSVGADIWRKWVAIRLYEPLTEQQLRMRICSEYQHLDEQQGVATDDHVEDYANEQADGADGTDGDGDGEDVDKDGGGEDDDDDKREDELYKSERRLRGLIRRADWCARYGVISAPRTGYKSQLFLRPLFQRVNGYGVLWLKKALFAGGLHFHFCARELALNANFEDVLPPVPTYRAFGDAIDDEDDGIPDPGRWVVRRRELRQCASSFSECGLYFRATPRMPPRPALVMATASVASASETAVKESAVEDSAVVSGTSGSSASKTATKTDESKTNDPSSQTSKSNSNSQGGWQPDRIRLCWDCVDCTTCEGSVQPGIAAYVVVVEDQFGGRRGILIDAPQANNRNAGTHLPLVAPSDGHLHRLAGESSVGNGVPQMEHTVTGLEPRHRYQVCVYAVSAEGFRGASSPKLTVVTAAHPPELRLLRETRTQLWLGWQPQVLTQFHHEQRQHHQHHQHLSTDSPPAAGGAGGFAVGSTVFVDIFHRAQNYSSAEHRNERRGAAIGPGRWWPAVVKTAEWRTDPDEENVEVVWLTVCFFVEECFGTFRDATFRLRNHGCTRSGTDIAPAAVLGAAEELWGWAVDFAVGFGRLYAHPRWGPKRGGARPDYEHALQQALVHYLQFQQLHSLAFCKRAHAAITEASTIDDYDHHSMSFSDSGKSRGTPAPLPPAPPSLMSPVKRENASGITHAHLGEFVRWLLPVGYAEEDCDVIVARAFHAKWSKSIWPKPIPQHHPDGDGTGYWAGKEMWGVVDVAKKLVGQQVTVHASVSTDGREEIPTDVAGVVVSAAPDRPYRERTKMFDSRALAAQTTLEGVNSTGDVVVGDTGGLWVFGVQLDDTVGGRKMHFISASEVLSCAERHAALQRQLQLQQRAKTAAKALEVRRVGDTAREKECERISAPLSLVKSDGGSEGKRLRGFELRFCDTGEKTTNGAEAGELSSATDVWKRVPLYKDENKSKKKTMQLARTAESGEDAWHEMGASMVPLQRALCFTGSGTASGQHGHGPEEEEHEGEGTGTGDEEEGDCMFSVVIDKRKYFKPRRHYQLSMCEYVHLDSTKTDDAGYGCACYSSPADGLSYRRQLPPPPQPPMVSASLPDAPRVSPNSSPTRGGGRCESEQELCALEIKLSAMPAVEESELEVPGGLLEIGDRSSGAGMAVGTARIAALKLKREQRALDVRRQICSEVSNLKQSVEQFQTSVMTEYGINAAALAAAPATEREKLLSYSANHGDELTTNGSGSRAGQVGVESNGHMMHLGYRSGVRKYEVHLRQEAIVNNDLPSTSERNGIEADDPAVDGGEGAQGTVAARTVSTEWRSYTVDTLGVPSGESALRIPGLLPSCCYSLRGRAVNSEGTKSAWSRSVHVVTSPPSPVVHMLLPQTTQPQRLLPLLPMSVQQGAVGGGHRSDERVAIVAWPVVLSGPLPPTYEVWMCETAVGKSPPTLDPSASPSIGSSTGSSSGHPYDSAHQSIWAAVPLYANSSGRDGSGGSAAAVLPLVDLDGHALSIGAVGTGSMNGATDASADNALLAEDGGSSSLSPVIHALRGSALSASVRLPGRVFKPSRSYWFSVRAVFPLTHAQVSASNSGGVGATWVRSSLSAPACLHTPPAAPTPIVMEITTTTIGISFPALSTQGVPIAAMAAGATLAYFELQMQAQQATAQTDRDGGGDSAGGDYAGLGSGVGAKAVLWEDEWRIVYRGKQPTALAADLPSGRCHRFRLLLVNHVGVASRPSKVVEAKTDVGEEWYWGQHGLAAPLNGEAKRRSPSGKVPLAMSTTTSTTALRTAVTILDPSHSEMAASMEQQRQHQQHGFWSAERSSTMATLRSAATSTEIRLSASDGMLPPICQLGEHVQPKGSKYKQSVQRTVNKGKGKGKSKGKQKPPLA
jgi:hypothetical protein